MIHHKMFPYYAKQREYSILIKIILTEWHNIFALQLTYRPMPRTNQPANELKFTQIEL